MKFLLLFIAFTVAYTDCPFWKCNQNIPSNYCIHQISTNSPVSVSEKFENSTDVCYVSNFYNLTAPYKVEIQLNLTKTQDQIKQEVQNKFCQNFTPESLQEKLQCKKYCSNEQRDGYLQKNCDFQKYYSDLEEQTKNLKKGAHIG